VDDPRDAELNEYRPISATALLGLVLAVASLSAFAHPVMWIAPVVAALVCLLSLARIAQHDPPLLGRSLALLGLSLALVIGGAAPARYVTAEMRARYEAQRLGLRWFQMVARHRFESAFELMMEPLARQPAGEDLVTHYREERAAGKALQEFLQGPVVRAVAAVGENAEFHPLETAEHSVNSFKDRIAMLWAVTYDEGGKRKSFLVRLSFERDAKEARHIGEWRLRGITFAPHPPKWLKT